ncbi:MAG: dephospho-CoA kinase [Chloroflexota bacterium]
MKPEELDQLNNMNENNFKAVGITGGIGAGKSAVAKIISSMGYAVVSTDDLAKKLMRESKELRRAIKDEFGEESYLDGGELNAKHISSIVFGDESGERLGALNRLVHPAVIDAMSDEIDAAEQRGEKMAFVESALIYEVGLDEGFDYIIAVDCPEEIAVERAAKRAGTTPENIRKTAASQIPPKEKIDRADFTIDNSGTLEELEKRVKFIVTLLESM